MSGASCTGSNQATNQQRNEANGSVTRRYTMANDQKGRRQSNKLSPALRASPAVTRDALAAKGPK